MSRAASGNPRAGGGRSRADGATRARPAPRPAAPPPSKPSKPARASVRTADAVLRPRRAAGRPPSPAGSRYLAESERPWVSLVFVLPLILAYEAYAMGFFGGRGTDAVLRGDGHITAFVLIDELFALFGATGRHLPAIALVAMLLSAHLMRRDVWKIRLKTLVGMAAESLFWAAPLIVLGWVLARLLPLGVPSQTQRVVLLSLGAGLYEEMLFRLIGVSAFVLILQQGFGLQARVIYPTVLIGLGLLFSLYHYLGPNETFAWRPFLFRTAAGCYLGTVYVLRGFGVTAASHAAYDIAVGTLLAA